MTKLVLAWIASAAFAAATNVAAFNTTELDCGVRRLVAERVRSLQPWRRSFRDVFDALQLELLCGDRPEDAGPVPLTSSNTLGHPSVGFPTDRQFLEIDDSVFFVSSAGDGDDIDGNGDQQHPFATLSMALRAARNANRTKSRRTIVLREGIHFLNSTLVLGPDDSGTTITAAAGEEVWISGGVQLPIGADWKPAQDGIGVAGTWQIDLPQTVKEVPGLFSLKSTDRPNVYIHNRYTRARFPNADAEVVQWGYSSAGRYNFSLPAGVVSEWHKPSPGGAQPIYEYVDLSVSGNPSGVVKNDSTMQEYNTWGQGHGGVCSSVWSEPSYWCGNNSAGGWSEVDQQAAAAGQLGIPVGLTFYPNYNENYNCSDSDASSACVSKKLGDRAAQWRDPVGAIVHAWHSQSWAMHMFEVAEFDATNHSLRFSRGGWQGGRSWCRCDQCTYVMYGHHNGCS